MRDKVPFVVVELVHILRKVHFLSCPEGRLGLLVHLPDLRHESVKGIVVVNKGSNLVILNGEEHKAMF